MLPPIDIGFSSADFQEGGPAKHNNTNWGQFYQKHFPEWSSWATQKREAVIPLLKNLNVRFYRFSVSRDQVEPQEGQFKEEGKEPYRRFIRQLKENGIEPLVTLHHFSDPLYFNWENRSLIEGFVNYAKETVAFLYEEGVRKIITINEPITLLLQGWIRGVYPPGKKRAFKEGMIALEYMMRAHMGVYRAVKPLYPDLEIGLSHNPLKFYPFHKFHPLCTPIERVACHYLTEIGHTALLRFFQTGRFHITIPFVAKHSFAFPFTMDFIGIQYYTCPILSFTRRGLQSVSRHPSDKLSGYHTNVDPNGLIGILNEYGTLNIPIEITEVGVDTQINKDEKDQERIEYFTHIFEVVQKALRKGIPVRSLYFWTLIDNLEWDMVWTVRFGFYAFEPKTGEITPRGVSLWIKSLSD